MELALSERLLGGLGFAPAQRASVFEDELRRLRHVAAALDSGFPLVGPPLMRAGSTGIEISGHIHAISRRALPLAAPVLDQLHQRLVAHFVEQAVVDSTEVSVAHRRREE